MTQALIAFGANLGDAQSSLDEAARRLADHAEIEVRAVAKALVTPAVCGEGDDRGDDADVAPDYLNSAIRVDTNLQAEALLQFTRRLEDEMGRQRGQRWGPRTIDLDIILFGDQVIDQPQLQVPHPRMSFRQFVIGPASRIAGELTDPISGVTLNDLAHRLQNSPRSILWITGDRESAEEAETGNAEVAAAILGANPSQWRLQLADNIASVETALNDFRLLLFSDSEQSFEDAALRFAGPWLNLSGLATPQCRREIRAAIEAMDLELN